MFNHLYFSHAQNILQVKLVLQHLIAAQIYFRNVQNNKSLLYLLFFALTKCKFNLESVKM